MAKILYDSAKKYGILQKQQKDTVKEFFKKKDSSAKKGLAFAVICFVLLGIALLFSDLGAIKIILLFFAFISTFLI